LNDEKEYSETEIKKQYRSKILQYHPDKNSSADAAEKFIEVQDAYKFLHSNANDEDKNASYKDVLHSFLYSILREEETNGPLLCKLMEMICKKICFIIDHNVDAILDYLRNINNDTLKIVYSILSKYRQIFHFSEDLISSIEELLAVNECVVLNPTLDDLMSEDNVYILKNEGKSYLVPLWHHEIIFDCSFSKTTQQQQVESKRLVVKIFPLLPENMELDDCNVLTVRLRYRLDEVWDRDVIVDVGGVPFVIHGKELRLTSSPQIVKYEECGVPYNNIDDVFDSAIRQSVVFIIRVF
jgi:hypothetical protein